MDELLDKVLEWADEKGLLENSNEVEIAQLNKLKEEHEEFQTEMFIGDLASAKKELGDVLVVCTILAYHLETDMEAVLQGAYDKISKRTGKTVNGQFVKDE